MRRNLLALFQNFCRTFDKSGNICQICRDDHGVVFFGKFAEFGDILFCQAQIDGIISTLAFDGGSNGGDTVGGCLGDQTDLFGTADRFIDTFLLFAFGMGDSFAFFTVGAVDFA